MSIRALTYNRQWYREQARHADEIVVMPRASGKCDRIESSMSAEPQESLTPRSQELLDRATQCFGNKDAAVGWLQASHPTLDGKIPFDLADDPDGYQEVMDELGRIENGIFA